MKKRKSGWKRGLSAFAAAMMLFSTPMTAKADVYWPEGPSIETPSAIIVEVNTGAILYEKNADEKNYPASITKVMTTLLALEHCDLDEIVTFSDTAIRDNQGATSHIARDYGEKMTMKDCLYAVMLESANECAYAVAEHVGKKLGGDYRTFIDLMNQKAKELGCTNTHFNNSNGLPDKEHWTSAHDMGLISAEAYRNETFRIIVGTRRHNIPPTNKHKDITPLNNHHAMISNYKTTKHLYEYSTGGKTGFTEASGHTLVSYAEKDGLVLACVVMRTTSGTQYEDSRKLFDYCFKNFQTVPIVNDESSDESGDKKNNGIMNNHSPFVELDSEAYVVLPVTADVKDVKMSLGKTDLKNGVIAQMNYTYGERIVGSVNVVLSKPEVEENYFDKEETPTDKNVIEVKPSYILIALVALIAVVAIIVIIKRLYDNFYVILHDMEVRRQRKDRFRPVSRKRKRRKRKDRMFK